MQQYSEMSSLRHVQICVSCDLNMLQITLNRQSKSVVYMPILYYYGRSAVVLSFFILFRIFFSPRIKMNDDEMVDYEVTIW